MPYAARLDYLGLLGLWFNGRPRKALSLVGLALIFVDLACAACGESPAALTAFRTEEQA